jgi:hypothetical protein
MERILLVGTEEVSNAGHRMSAAAETMRKAANTIDDAIMRHKQYLEDWMLRFEQCIGKLTDTHAGPKGL